MKNVTKAAVITLVAGGIAAVGAGAASAAGGAGAQGAAVDSRGIASGNIIQAPVHVPVNACGNTVSVIGLLNPTFGGTCLDR